MQAHSMLIADTSTYNCSMAKIEIDRSGINELYPPVGRAEADAAVAAAASSAAFFSASSFSVAARLASLDMVMKKATMTNLMFLKRFLILEMIS